MHFSEGQKINLTNDSKIEFSLIFLIIKFSFLYISLFNVDHTIILFSFFIFSISSGLILLSANPIILLL